MQKFAARIARGFSGVANYIPLHKSSNGLWIDSLRANWLSLFAKHLRSGTSKFVVSRYLSGSLCLCGEITGGKHFATAEQSQSHRENQTAAALLKEHDKLQTPPGDRHTHTTPAILKLVDQMVRFSV